MSKMNCHICNVEYHIKGIGTHIKKSHKMTSEEYYIKYILNGKEYKCECGNKPNFFGITTGYSEHCSNRCAQLSDITRNKIKQTCMKRYGVEHTLQVEEIREKGKKTKLEKYGSETYNNMEKNKQTKLKNFGVEYSFQSDVLKAKRDKTKLERYGSEQYNNRDKYKETCLEKYGVDNPSKFDDIVTDIRVKALKRIKNRTGQIMPNYNPSSIPIIEQYGKENGYNFQHAENGGEHHIKELGYWVDGYDKDKNVVVEYYENYHTKQTDKDKRRKQEIINLLGCKFIELKEWQTHTGVKK